MKRIIIAIMALSLLVCCFAGFVGCGSKQDEGTITIRNLYFENWSAQEGDPYIQFMQNKFGIKFKTSTYSFEDWNTQVNSSVLGGQVPDVFQANVTSYNFEKFYTYWAKGEVTKALPSDLSNWPNLKKMIESVADLDYLKYNGKLYGIPVLRNLNTSSEASFAPFTYMYRRDVAKNLGVYQEDDIYTWEQFEALLAAFKVEFAKTGGYALGDSEWGYPSVLNFYKTAPHCFAELEDGTIVNNYYTDEYQAGLAKAKQFVDNRWYYLGQVQVAEQQNQVKKQYTSKKLGVFYENLSLANYLQIRDAFVKADPGISDEALNDCTAIMKVKGPDGKYALEGQEQWFSMVFLNYDISEAKMNKILDIFDWLLSEEGTMMALYGIEGQDYEILGANSVNYDIEYKGQKIKLLSSGNLWEKSGKGEYVDAWNGVKYMRNVVTLGHDIDVGDPIIQNTRKKKAAYDILNDWTSFMNSQYDPDPAKTNLKVLTEPADVKWMQTKEKLKNAGTLLDDANTMVLLYSFGRKSFSEYRSAMTNSTWTTVLREINANRKK